MKSEQYQYIQRMINEHPVIMFSKTTCSYCAMAKNLLNEVGVNYEVEEIDRRTDTDKLQDVFAKITSARTVSCSSRLVNIWDKNTVLVSLMTVLPHQCSSLHIAEIEYCIRTPFL